MGDTSGMQSGVYDLSPVKKKLAKIQGRNLVWKHICHSLFVHGYRHSIRLGHNDHTWTSIYQRINAFELVAE